MNSKRQRINTSESSDSIAKLMQCKTNEVLSLFEEHLRKNLNLKQLEIRTLTEKMKYMEKSYEEKIKSQNEKIMKLMEDNKILSAENKKLLTEKPCEQCDQKEKIISEQKKELESKNSDEIRWKNHIFKRQTKLKSLKKILVSRDETICELEDRLEAAEAKIINNDKPYENRKTESKTFAKTEEYVEYEYDKKESPLINQIDNFLNTINSDEIDESKMEVTEDDNDKVDDIVTKKSDDDTDHSTKIDKIAKAVLKRGRKKRNVS